MKNDTKLNKWKLKYTKKFISKLKTKYITRIYKSKQTVAPCNTRYELHKEHICIFVIF